MKLSFDYIAFDMELTLRERVAHKMQELGISLFQYIKCSSDGRYTYISTKMDLLRHFMQAYAMQPIVPMFFSDQLMHQTKYWYFIDDVRNLEQLELWRRLGACHPAAMTLRSGGAFENFTVALSKYTPNFRSFYLSNVQKLERFFIQFKIEHQDLISSVEQANIYLDKSQIPKTHAKILSSKSKRLLYNGQDFHVTAQEFRCLEFLKMGLSTKEIGNLMSISSRSVETYRDRVKERLGVGSRNEMFDLISQIG